MALNWGFEKELLGVRSSLSEFLWSTKMKVYILGAGCNFSAINTGLLSSKQKITGPRQSTMPQFSPL